MSALSQPARRSLPTQAPRGQRQKPAPKPRGQTAATPIPTAPSRAAPSPALQAASLRKSLLPRRIVRPGGNAALANGDEAKTGDTRSSVGPQHADPPSSGDVPPTKIEHLDEIVVDIVPVPSDDTTQTTSDLLLTGMSASNYHDQVNDTRDRGQFGSSLENDFSKIQSSPFAASVAHSRATNGASPSADYATSPSPVPPGNFEDDEPEIMSTRSQSLYGARRPLPTPPAPGQQRRKPAPKTNAQSPVEPALEMPSPMTPPPALHVPSSSQSSPFFNGFNGVVGGFRGIIRPRGDAAWANSGDSEPGDTTSVYPQHANPPKLYGAPPTIVEHPGEIPIHIVPASGDDLAQNPPSMVAIVHGYGHNQAYLAPRTPPPIPMDAATAPDWQQILNVRPRSINEIFPVPRPLSANLSIHSLVVSRATAVDGSSLNSEHEGDLSRATTACPPPAHKSEFVNIWKAIQRVENLPWTTRIAADDYAPRAMLNSPPTLDLRDLGTEQLLRQSPHPDPHGMPPQVYVYDSEQGKYVPGVSYSGWPMHAGPPHGHPDHMNEVGPYPHLQAFGEEDIERILPPGPPGPPMHTPGPSMHHMQPVPPMPGHMSGLGLSQPHHSVQSLHHSAHHSVQSMHSAPGMHSVPSMQEAPSMHGPPSRHGHGHPGDGYGQAL